VAGRFGGTKGVTEVLLDLTTVQPELAREP
jgi:hypothetical protein